MEPSEEDRELTKDESVGTSSVRTESPIMTAVEGGGDEVVSLDESANNITSDATECRQDAEDTI